MRADPLVAPGAISSHVHSISGGNAIDFAVSYDELRQSSCSTCAARQDLSLYWMPSVWFHAKNGSFLPARQITSTIYYLQRPSRSGERVHAFPKGFRMLAGDMTLRSFDANEPTQRAITFNCLDISNNATGAAGEFNHFPLHNCPGGLRAQVFFPQCWDGQSLDSANHKSHVAYPSGVDSGDCPASHPVRLIGIFYEFVYDSGVFATDWWDGGSTDIGQPFVLAQGDPTGYGLHADFISGWDVDVLQRAADECTADSGVIEECGALSRDLRSVEEMNDCAVPPRVPERITGWMKQLPGCNPIQAGPAKANAVTSCDANPPSGNSFVSRSAVSFVADTSVSQWTRLGCAKEPPGGRILSELWTDLNATAVPMNIDRCVQHCNDAGWRYAGLENGNECWCGAGLSKPATEIVGQYVCDTPCADGSFASDGMLPLYCGGPSRLALYRNTGLPPPKLGKPRCRVRKKMSSLEAAAIGKQQVLAAFTSPTSRR